MSFSSSVILWIRVEEREGKGVKKDERRGGKGKGKGGSGERSLLT
jgi:hypothetical protein